MAPREAGVYAPPGRIGYLDAAERAVSGRIIWSDLICYQPGFYALEPGHVFVELGPARRPRAIHEITGVEETGDAIIFTTRSLRALTEDEAARMSAHASALEPAPSFRLAPTEIVMIVLELVT